MESGDMELPIYNTAHNDTNSSELQVDLLTPTKSTYHRWEN